MRTYLFFKPAQIHHLLTKIDEKSKSSSKSFDWFWPATPQMMPLGDQPKITVIYALHTDFQLPQIIV